MKILHLESSSKNCSVTISDGEEILCICEEISENFKQAESLHVFVQWALEGAEITLSDLDVVCVGKGPGSYTGLRIGSSAAKGFCFALNIPLIAVDSTESMVFPFIGEGYDVIVPLIDARRMEVYTAIYDGHSGERLNEIQALILDENSFSELEGKKILFVGDGCEKAETILQFINAEFKKEVYPSAQYLVDAAIKKYNASEFEDVAYFEPAYLKDFQGVKKKS